VRNEGTLKRQMEGRGLETQKANH